jgi:DNA primase
MEISDIKSRLTLANVLHHYGLKPDKSLRLNCPFHEDKTPSLQVYYKTHTAYCFSANCQTHGKSLDTIDFIMYMEKSTKHEAINKAKELITGIKPNPAEQLTRTAILTNQFTYFKNAVHNSKPARDYIAQRGLDFTKLEIGYNTGQFHHGSRRDEQLIRNCVQVGLLSPFGSNTRTGGQAYKSFAKECICFALKNQANQITGLYFRSIASDKDQRHFYLKDRSGLYPHYPKAATQKLILTESIIDAASLLQIESISKEYGILALYGTNGLTKEHSEAISQVKELNEIVFFLNGDEAGKKATAKHAETFKNEYPNLRISNVHVPENEDVNSLLQAHQPEIFQHLLESRSNLFLSTEKKNSPNSGLQASNSASPNSQLPTPDFTNPNKLIYTTETATYCILGGIPKQLDMLKVMLQIENKQGFKSRNKLDLYEDKQVERLCKEVAEKLQIRKDLMEKDLYELTELIENYRENTTEENKTPAETLRPLTAHERQLAEDFLKKEHVIKRLNELLGKTGIVGEERSRIFLLLIAISYKMKDPLHALVQGSSGSGKTKIVRQVSDCIPQESVTRFTRISDKALYNYPKNYFTNRLLIIEDVDGLSEDAEMAFRELQSSGELRSSVSIKLENGSITAGEKIVSGPIASMSCTTKGEVYEDNMSRVFLLAVDESMEQTKRIIQYQNQKASGKINSKEEQQAKIFIQNLIRIIEAKEVINPFAEKIQLPEEAHKIRRLNDLFQNFIKMVTLINQYQRRRASAGHQLIAEIEDVETAIEIMFESIVLKVDELDGSLRQFYEQLKSFIEKKSTGYEFNRFEVREATGLGKTQQHHYLTRLTELEYIQQNGFANRGFRYKIVHWDNYKTLRDRIKYNLKAQIEKLKSNADTTRTEHQPNANRTLEKN